MFANLVTLTEQVLVLPEAFPPFVQSVTDRRKELERPSTFGRISPAVLPGFNLSVPSL